MSGNPALPGLLALLIGVVARLGYAWTPWVFTVFAVGELITDQLPSTPSRTVPVQFGTRILMGAMCGAALSAAALMVLAQP